MQAGLVGKGSCKASELSHKNEPNMLSGRGTLPSSPPSPSRRSLVSETFLAILNSWFFGRPLAIWIKGERKSNHPVWSRSYTLRRTRRSDDSRFILKPLTTSGPGDMSPTATALLPRAQKLWLRWLTRIACRYKNQAFNMFGARFNALHQNVALALYWPATVAPTTWICIRHPYTLLNKSCILLLLKFPKALQAPERLPRLPRNLDKIFFCFFIPLSGHIPEA